MNIKHMPKLERSYRFAHSGVLLYLVITYTLLRYRINKILTAKRKRGTRADPRWKKWSKKKEIHVHEWSNLQRILALATRDRRIDLLCNLLSLKFIVAEMPEDTVNRTAIRSYSLIDTVASICNPLNICQEIRRDNRIKQLNRSLNNVRIATEIEEESMRTWTVR